jgi:predicted amidohydrolase
MDPSIRLAQVEPTLGNLTANLDAHLAMVGQAIDDGIDLIAFPELSLTGYFLKDQTSDVARGLDAPELQALIEVSRDISIVVGFVERGRDGRVYNATAFLEDGRVLGVHRKVHLVTYGMFEESRDFAAGENFDPIESKHGRFGILTCEDVWHMDGAYLYFMAGVDAFLVNSAGPGRGVTQANAEDGPAELTSNRTWRTIQDGLALWTRTPVLYVNRVGWEDGIVFAGATRAVDADANPIAGPLGLDAGHLDVPLELSATQRSRTRTPLRRDEKPWILARGLTAHTGLVPPPESGTNPG